MRRRSVTYTALTSALLVAALIATATIAGAAPSRTEQLRAQLNEVNDEFRRAGAAYDKAYWALDETEVKVAKSNKRLKVLKKELKSEQAQLSSRVEAWYRGDDFGFIEVLLTSSSWNDFVNRLDYVQRISGADADAIDKIEHTVAKIKKEQAQLKKEQAAQNKRLAQFKKQRDALQARLKKSRAEYNALQAKLAAAAKAEKGSGYVPASGGGVRAVAGPNGMVFPVAGPNYYSDTWGASRGGGRRRHKGTDIMASTGTPCVATLSGTVTVRRGNTAGLWIILRADNGWQFWYMHLNTTTVSSGSRVSAGQQIGTVGYSGNANASAPHLHYEIHPGGGSAVNPYPYLRQMQGR